MFVLGDATAGFLAGLEADFLRGGLDGGALSARTGYTLLGGATALGDVSFSLEGRDAAGA